MSLPKQSAKLRLSELCFCLGQKQKPLDSIPACHVAFTLNLSVCSVLQVSWGRDCVHAVVSSAGVSLLDILIHNELFSPLKMQINHMLKVILLAMGSCRKKKKHFWMTEVIAATAGCCHLAQFPLSACRASAQPLGNMEEITTLPQLGTPPTFIYQSSGSGTSYCPLDCNPAHFKHLLHCLPF